MDIRAAEISKILKDQISNFGKEAEVSEVGQVLSVGDGIARVYGLDNAVDPVTGGPVAGEVRRRDPVVAYRYGDKEFFLGFWLEIDTDMETPEFLGITQPWAPKRGRGRPPKGLPW